MHRAGRTPARGITRISGGRAAARWRSRAGTVNVLALSRISTPCVEVPHPRLVVCSRARALDVRWVGVCIALSVASGCATSPSLAVQLVTDLSPGRDFDAIAISIDGTGERTVVAHGDFDRSRRLASYEGLAPGRHTVRVVLSWQGLATQRATRIVDVDGASFVTVRITRDCRSVTCPSAADPAATECVAGRCVAPTCTPETPSACGAPACDPAVCSGGPTCVTRACSAEGLCVAEPDDQRCAASELCDTERGCVPRCTGATCGAVACSWATTPTLTAPVPLTTVASTSLDLDPSLSHDGLTLWFASDRAGTFDIYEARRPTLDADFGPPARRADLSAASVDVAPFVFEDPDSGETETWIVSDRDTATLGLQTELYRAVGAVPLARVVELSTAAYEYDPRLNRSGLTLWFSRGDTIWVAQRTTLRAPFGVASEVTELGPGAVADPSTTDDELTMLFTRTDASTAEVWVATRTSPSVPWDAPRRVEALNTDTTNDGQVFVRADGCEVLFARDGHIVQSRVVP